MRKNYKDKKFNKKLKIFFKLIFTGVEEDRQMLPICICKGIFHKDIVFIIWFYVIFCKYPFALNLFYLTTFNSMTLIIV